MDLEKMREFVVFSGYMNFTAAAKCLHVSQPSLSKHIKDLELELGVDLVVRGEAGEGNVITAAGQRFLERAQELLKDYDELVRECRSVGMFSRKAQVHSLNFALGISAQINAALPDGNRYFAFKKVDEDIRDSLDRGSIDLAVHYEAVPEMRKFASEENRARYGWIPLESERLCFYLRAAHPLARSESVPLAEFARYDMVNEYSASYRSWYDVLESLFAKRGCSLTFKLVAQEPRDGLCLPLGDSDVCLCTERCARYFLAMGDGDTKIVHASDPGLAVHPFLVYRLDNNNPCVMKIVEAMAATGGAPRGGA